MKKLLLVALCLAGCGAEAPNPLVGSWKGMVQGGTMSFDLKSDQKYDEEMAAIDAASGCNSKLTFSGTWTSTATAISTSPSSGHLLVTGCSKAAENNDRDTTAMENAVYSVNAAYSINMTQLTLSMAGMPITLNKQ